MLVMTDVTPVYGPWTGIAYYTDAIARRLNAEADGDTCVFVHEGLVSSSYSPPGPAGSGRSRTMVARVLSGVTAVSMAARSVRDRRWAHRVRSVLGSHVPDVYFEPNIVLHGYAARKRVVTVHDLSFVHHPEWFPARAAYLRTSVKQTVRLADLVLTGSVAIKAEIVESFGVSEDRIRVIRHGVDHELFHPVVSAEEAPLGLEALENSGCVLSVCSLDPRKNLLTLLDAFALLPPELRKAHPLVLAGLPGWRSQEVTSRVAALKGDASYLGYIRRSELAWLYRQSSLLVYPSLYEGFGLPPLEALSSGTPALVSNIPVFHELFDGVAAFADVARPESLSLKMGEMLADRGRLDRMRAEGPRLAAGFSWDRSAHEHMACFRDVSGAVS